MQTKAQAAARANMPSRREVSRALMAASDASRWIVARISEVTEVEAQCPHPLRSIKSGSNQHGTWTTWSEVQVEAKAIGELSTFRLGLRSVQHPGLGLVQMNLVQIGKYRFVRLTDLCNGGSPRRGHSCGIQLSPRAGYSLGVVTPKGERFGSSFEREDVEKLDVALRSLVELLFSSLHALSKRLSTQLTRVVQRRGCPARLVVLQDLAQAARHLVRSVLGSPRTSAGTSSRKAAELRRPLRRSGMSVVLVQRVAIHFHKRKCSRPGQSGGLE